MGALDDALRGLGPAGRAVLDGDQRKAVTGTESSPPKPPTVTSCPDRVRRLLDRRAGAVQQRRAAYRHWHEETQELLAERQRWIDQHIRRNRDRGLDYGIDL